MTILKIQELDTLEELSNVEAQCFNGQLGLGFGFDVSGLPVGLGVPSLPGNVLGLVPSVAGNVLGLLPSLAGNVLGGLPSVGGNLLGGLLNGLPLP